VLQGPAPQLAFRAVRMRENNGALLSVGNHESGAPVWGLLLAERSDAHLSDCNLVEGLAFEVVLDALAPAQRAGPCVELERELLASLLLRLRVRHQLQLARDANHAPHLEATLQRHVTRHGTPRWRAWVMHLQHLQI